MRTALILVAALLGGCVTSTSITQHPWQVEFIHERPLIDRSFVSISFADDRASGSAGCNQWFSSYELKGAALSFKAPATTRKMCAPALMEQESRFLKALADVTSWQVNERGQLELVNAQHQLIVLSPSKP